MTDYDQVPFSGIEFADNPEPRCPCVLLLDTSTSMSGSKINELNAGLQTFADQLSADSMAAKRSSAPETLASRSSSSDNGATEGAG